MRNAITSIIVLLLLAGFSCKDYKSGRFEGWTSYGTDTSSKASYDYFDGKLVKTRTFKAGISVVFSYDADIEKGAFDIKIISPGKDETSLVALGVGKNSGDVSFHVINGGDHEIIISGHQSKGRYSLSWEEKDDTKGAENR